jgi:hypothetical protein
MMNSILKIKSKISLAKPMKANRIKGYKTDGKSLRLDLLAELCETQSYKLL